MQSNSNAQSKPTAPQLTSNSVPTSSLFGTYQTNVQQPSLFQFPQQVNINQNVNTGPSAFGQYPLSQMSFSNSYVPQVQQVQSPFQHMPVQQQYSSAPQQNLFAPQQYLPPPQSMPTYSFGIFGGGHLRSQVESLKNISFADDELI